MKNILDQIMEEKKKEVEEKKLLFDLNGHRSVSSNFDRACVSLKQRLLEPGSTGIIAEFKRRSPSRGWFKEAGYPAPPTVMDYEKYGAAGASILTDTAFFGGELPDLAVVRTLCGLPLLRKDFIIDEIQVMEAKAYGADVILLIAASLSRARVRELGAAAKRLGMEVLLEIHGEQELEHICDEVDMVGINNRDLRTFRVDIQRSVELGKRIPPGKPRIAESGIDDVATIRRFSDAGFEGFLIGERFMKEPDPGAAFAAFVNELKQQA